MKSKIEALDRICANKFFPISFIVIAFLVILFYSETTSPIYGIEFGDSAVFKMMGHVLLNGGVPYVDYFDHKGPYLYLINAVGEWISPNIGLFVLQILWLSITLALWFKIARLFVSPAISFVALLLSVFCFLDYYEYGNLTEEWSLLPSSLALFLSLSYIIKYKNSPHEKWRSFVYGLCFGLMFFIRPNDAVIQCGGIMTGIFLYVCFVQKQYANAFINAFAFLLGFVLMAAPWIIYFAYNHSLEEFYFGLIGFNMNYSGGIIHNVTLVHITKKLLCLCFIPLLLVFESNHKEMLLLLVPVASLVILVFGRNDYPHYYMSLIPLGYLLLFALLFRLKLKPITIVGILLLMLTQYHHIGTSRGVMYAKRMMRQTHIDYPTIYEGDCLEYKNDNGEKLFAIIPKEERDSVWNYGDTFSALFYHNDIVSQNPVPPIIARKIALFPKEKQDILDISLQKPLWIFKKSESSYIMPTDSVFIANHYYVANKSESTSYLLLKRKDE